MSDQLLNQFLASGTAAERAAFTPDPATPAVGPDPTYLWLETDTQNVFMWDFDAEAWVLISVGGVSFPMVAGEDLDAGDPVNIYPDAGVAKIRKANADAAAKDCDGYVVEAVAAGDTGQVQRSGVVAGLAGLTPGEPVYLASAGGFTSAPPVAGIVQRLGKALSATTAAFRIQPAIEL